MADLAECDRYRLAADLTARGRVAAVTSGDLVDVGAIPVVPQLDRCDVRCCAHILSVRRETADMRELARACRPEPPPLAKGTACVSTSSVGAYEAKTHLPRLLDEI